MLSEDLKSLHDHLAAYKDNGLQMEPEAVETVCAILIVAAQDAAELESRTVPISDQVGDLPGNVVRIASVLARKGARVGTRPCDRDPGGAA